jgi:catechol 2,3-dioxygenase-like lactoylglutathione lyase family enzyme
VNVAHFFRKIKEHTVAVTIRYIVKDVQEALDFYVHNLGFDVVMHPGKGFALLSRGQLHLALSGVEGEGGGSQATETGVRPQPGGWNRFQIEVEDLSSTVKRLKEQGVTFHNKVVTGKGGMQMLLKDPSGNLIELFEPHKEPR